MDDEMSAERTALKTRRRCADELEKLLYEHTESEDANGGRALFDPGLREIYALARRWRGEEVKSVPQVKSPQRATGYAVPRVRVSGYETTPWKRVDGQGLLAALGDGLQPYLGRFASPGVVGLNALLQATAQAILLNWLNASGADLLPTDWEIAVATRESKPRDFPGLEGVLKDAASNLAPTEALLFARNRKEGKYLSIAELEALALSAEHRKLTGTLCSICGGRQWLSPGGATCDEGHGGAPPLEPPPGEKV